MDEMIIQNQYIKNLATKGMRIDKRKPDEYRKIQIELNPIPKAEGSARVKFGNTEVLVGVKLGIGEPFSDRPNEGVLMVGAELSPVASSEFEPGPPKEESIELARVIDRGIRESKTIDLEKLCIKKGELVWMVYVDIEILNHDGNLLDAAALAATTALQNTEMLEHDGRIINYEKRKGKLPVKYKPIAVTFTKVGNSIFVDANLEEERASEGGLIITTKDDGNVVSMQKLGPCLFTVDEVNKILEDAVKKSKELRKLV